MFLLIYGELIRICRIMDSGCGNSFQSFSSLQSGLFYTLKPVSPDVSSFWWRHFCGFTPICGIHNTFKLSQVPLISNWWDYEALQRPRESIPASHRSSKKPGKGSTDYTVHHLWRYKLSGFFYCRSESETGIVVNSFPETEGFDSSRNEDCSSKTITKKIMNCYGPSFLLSWADLGFLVYDTPYKREWCKSLT